MNLTHQQQLVYNCLRDNPRITIREMHRMIPVDKCSARLSELSQKGIAIKKYGRNKYREMMYGLEKQMTKRVQRTEMTNTGVRVWYEEVNV